jgi:lipoate---protein ligase
VGGWSVEERTGSASSLHAAWPEAAEHPDRRIVGVCHVTSPALVLGSTQAIELIDSARAESGGVAVARRRSGGGVVLVAPGNPVWIDVWLPAGDPLWKDDVGAAFDWLADAWVDSLRLLGIEGVSAHRGGSVHCTRWASSVCFGGVGRGEVVLEDGRKLVGLAQRRTRAGAWFHGACFLNWDPLLLVDLLNLTGSEKQAALGDLLAAAAGVAEVADERGVGPIGGVEIVGALLTALGGDSSR